MASSALAGSLFNLPFSTAGVHHMSLSHHFRGGADQPVAKADVNSKPLRYGLFKRFLDWRNATRDGRDGRPIYAQQPATTPTIRRLVAEFAEQAAGEHASCEKHKAVLEHRLAKVLAEIKAMQNAVNLPRAQIAGAEQDGIQSVRYTDVEVWRLQQDAGELAAKQAEQVQLDQEIARRHKQYLDRRNQLAAHTWRRIETYWDRLIHVHPDGERLNEVADNWGPAQVGGPLRRLLDVADQVINSDESHNAISSSENDGHAQY